MAHALLFLVAGWTVLHPDDSSAFSANGGLELLPPVVEGGEAAEGPSSAVSPPLDTDRQREEEDSRTVFELEGAGTGEAGRRAGDNGDALLERLASRTMPRPTLARPAETQLERVVTGEESVAATGEGDPIIDGTATTTDLSALPASDSLDLERLAELRPELALITPSAWVLIRNPIEVEAFLRRSYGWGRIDSDAKGSVNVTLWIDERGSVEWAEVSKSSGRADLDEVALAVFNEVALFRPAREEGVSVSRSVTFALNFPW